MFKWYYHMFIYLHTLNKFLLPPPPPPPPDPREGCDRHRPPPPPEPHRHLQWGRPSEALEALRCGNQVETGRSHWAAALLSLDPAVCHVPPQGIKPGFMWTHTSMIHHIQLHVFIWNWSLCVINKKNCCVIENLQLDVCAAELYLPRPLRVKVQLYICFYWKCFVHFLKSDSFISLN